MTIHISYIPLSFFFFFQAEDGIRDYKVTGVQTCALPICDEVRQSFEAEFRPIFMTSTTGRSADPIPFLFAQHDLENLALTGKRLFEVCGAQREMRILNMFPYAPHLAFWQTHFGGTAFGVFVTSTGGGKVMGTDGNLRVIRKIKPDVLI